MKTTTDVQYENKVHNWILLRKKQHTEGQNIAAKFNTTSENNVKNQNNHQFSIARNQ